MKSKLVKEFLNEGTYDDFFMNYGNEIKEAINKLKNINTRLHKGEIEEDDVWDQLDKLENIYDEAVVSWIENSITNPTSYNINAQELVMTAMRNMDAQGTEMRMIIYAIEELNL